MEIKYYSGFILINRENKICLQLRTSDAPIDSDCWAVFGGKMKKNETPESCVKREAFEELKLKSNFKFFRKFKFMEKDGLHVSFVFFSFFDGSIYELKKNLSEGQDVNFFSKKELNRIKLANSSKMILNCFYDEF